VSIFSLHPPSKAETALSIWIIGTACIVCAAGSMNLSGVRPYVLQSLCPSVSSQHLPQQQSLLLWLGQKEILSIDCCTAYSSAACGERMRAVPRCQLTSLLSKDLFVHRPKYLFADAGDRVASSNISNYRVFEQLPR